MIVLEKTKNERSFGNTIFQSIAVGRAFELLRKDLIDHLREIQNELHFKYCRFHGLFNEEMDIVQRLNNGTLAYQWHYIDKMTDNLLSVGLKPFFELGDMPDTLASGDTHACYWKMNSSEPKDYNEWGELVENFLNHMVDRYGLDEVRTWYFEVWNEPNIKAFWDSGIDAYYKLYKYTAKAVKNVDKCLRVGGPATAGGGYIKEMIDYCCENKLPLDFVTTHAYPVGEYCEYIEREGSPYELGEYFVGRFKDVRDAVLNSPMPELEIHWTEWNTMSAKNSKNISWICNPTVDTHFGGACVVRNMLGVKDICNSVAYWVASDIFEEAGMPHSVFSCTYGMVNINGIKKSTFNAYKLLRKMRGNLMDISNTEKYPLGCGLAATEEKDTVRVIAYNNQLPEIENQPDWSEELRIDLPDGEYVITSAKLEKGQGSCYETWIDMGMPQNLSPMQDEMLRFKSMMKYDFALAKASDGILKTSFNLKADEVIYLEIQKKDIKALPRKVSESFMEEWNNALMLDEK